MKFRPSVSAAQRSSLRTKLGADFLRTLPLIDAQVVSAEVLDDNYAKELVASGKIDYLEPNYIYRISALPNDPSFAELWGLHNTGQNGGTADIDIDAPEAWDLTTAGEDVVVGVVDTGINLAHPDLQANLWRNNGEIPGNNRDDDGNGVVDDVHGYNALAESGNPQDDNGHGSHCAGTIGAVGDNGTGVVGIGRHTKIMALKFLDANGSGTTEDAVEAIRYAVAMKQRGVNIRVLSNSWGGGGMSQALADAIALANQAGIVFIAAAGNASADNDLNPTYPANYESPNVVSVAAVDRNGNLAQFSNYGLRTVDLAAPGVDILSTIRGSGYASYQGTSMATPHVAGIASLLASHTPTLSAAELRGRIINTVKPLPGLVGQMLAPGIADAYNAILNRTTPIPPPSILVSYDVAPAAAALDPDFGSRVLDTDDGYSEVTLPFTFNYYKAPYTRLAISANGRIVPLAEGVQLPTESDFSNNLALGLSPYHDDLFPANNGGTFFKSDANSATVTWHVVPYLYHADPTGNSTITIQAKLFASGEIEFHYGDTYVGNGTYDNAGSATIGIAPAPPAAGEKLLVSHNSPAPETCGTGRALRFTVKKFAEKNDLDGDGLSDYILWRSSIGSWIALTSSSGFDPARPVVIPLGKRGDIPLVGDFDGDKKLDLAVWRAKGRLWLVRRSSDLYAQVSSFRWGKRRDRPVIGDFNGDGKSDFGLWRALERGGKFLTRLSIPGGAPASARTGSAGFDVPGRRFDWAAGDFSGDGRDEFVTIQKQRRVWTGRDITNQITLRGAWGQNGDLSIVCDHDENGIADRGTVRRAPDGSLNWYISLNTGETRQYLGFGQAGDQPHCSGDYDGDGHDDLTLFRPSTGEWLMRSSRDAVVSTLHFGSPGDLAP